MPDVSRTYGLPRLNALMKDQTNISATEAFLRANRQLLEAWLENKFKSTHKVAAQFNMFEEAAVRLLTSQSLGIIGFDHNVSGKFSVEKLSALRSAWMKHLENKYHELVGLVVGFGDPVESVDEKVADEVHRKP